ncbi:MAG: DUF6765 family protein [Thermodesulfobacteriota bacterium]|nr:DUF6765 family protein [Thermodesulfobacteriota bacterium]
MEKDYHFYVIYALAHTAGFTAEESHTIAYASQYVDDNNEMQYPEKDGQSQFPSKIRMNGGYFRPIMTQSMSVKSIIYEIQKFVYVPFHFLPGDNNQSVKGRYNRYSTTPNSNNARKLLKTALNSKDLYRIGISLHTYADTWSHQNFTGYEEDWNSVFTWHSPYRAIVPNIGHADVGHYPDEISTTWSDHRLEKPARKIHNRERAFEATKCIYQALRSAKQGTSYWSDVKKDFKKIIDAEDYDDRIDKVKEYVNSADLHYEKNKWVDEAIHKTGDELMASPHFTHTHWMKFQQAAKANFASTVDILKNY